MEQIREDLEVRGDKRKSFRQSILSLLVQWRDVEGQLDLTQEDFHERFRGLESKEKDLHALKESLELSQELLEQREKDFLLFVEKKMKFLELKEKKLVMTGGSYAKEVEEKFSEKEKRVQGLLAKLENEKLEMVGIKNFVEKRSVEIGVREKHLEDLRKQVELIRDSVEKKTHEVEEKENKLKEREEEVESKVHELDLMIKNIEFKEKQIDFIRRLYEERLNEIDMKGNQLENKSRLMKEKELVTKLLEKECQDLESRKELEKEMLGQEYKVLEARKKEFEDMIKNFDIRKKEIDLKEKELHESIMVFHSKKREFMLLKELTLDRDTKISEPQLHGPLCYINKYPYSERVMNFEQGRFPYPHKAMESRSPHPQMELSRFKRKRRHY